MAATGEQQPSAAITQDDLKKIAAHKAVEHVKSGMVVGLGTRSTAKQAVDRITELIHRGELNDVVGIPTSKATHDQAAPLGIPLSDLDAHPAVDLSIDGADEVDPALNPVKGRGGSLLREKTVESASDKFIADVDESKLVSHIGASRLAMPVEVVPYCWKYTSSRLEGLFAAAGCAARLRRSGVSGEAYVTDNGNYVIALYFEREIGDLDRASDVMIKVAGVVEHGLFLGMASMVIVAGVHGVEVMTKVGTSQL